MKKITITILIAAMFFQMGVLKANAEEKWNAMDSDHFIVYFKDNEKFAKDILNEAEKYYKDIAIEIGYPRYSDFWSWDKKVKIYLYKTHEEFLKATKQPSWSHGMASYTEKFIAGYEWSEEFIDSILPHEMAHLIFRDFVGFKGSAGLWLDEGVAQWAEVKRRSARKETVRALYSTDRLLKIDDLLKLSLNDVEKDKVYIKDTLGRSGGIAILIVDGDSLIKTYYLQAFSTVGFLIEKYGSTKFASFCRELKDKRIIEESITFAYSEYLHNLDELEKKWREYLEVDYKKNGGV